MRRVDCFVTALGFLVLLGIAAPARGQIAAKKLEQPRQHGGFFSFAFSPDGKTVAGGTGVAKVSGFGQTSAFGGEVLLWDATTGKLKNTLGSHGEGVDWLAYSRDGSVLASASKDNGLVKLWNMKRGKAGQTIKLAGKYASHAGIFPYLILSPDGRTLVAAVEKVTKIGKHTMSAAGEMTAWDAQTGKAKWAVPDSNVKGICLSPDGKTLAAYVEKTEWKQEGESVSGTPVERHISLWDADTGEVQKTIDPGDFHSVRAMAFLHDGKTLVGFTTQGITLCDTQTGEVTKGIKWGEDRWSFGAFAFAGDGKLVARANTEWVDLVDVNTGEVKGMLTTKFPKTWWHSTFSPDLKLIACSYEHGPSIITLPWPPQVAPPTKLPEERPAEATAEQPVEKPAEATAEQPEEQPAEATAEQPEEQPAEATAEQPEEQPVEKPQTPTKEFRTWTDSTGGFTVEARFVYFAAGKVRLEKTNGQKISVPLERLSKEDQQWVKDRGRR